MKEGGTRAEARLSLCWILGARALGATAAPVAALLPHVVVPAAAVLHGMATTAQLPPH